MTEPIGQNFRSPHEPIAPRNPEREIRQSVWSEMRRRVTNNIDGLDENAADLVTGFTLMGMKTFGSCQGHEGYFGPYVGKGDKKYDNQLSKPPYIAFHTSPAQPQENLERKLVSRLLTEFYQDKDVPVQDRLTLSELRPYVWQVSIYRSQVFSANDYNEVALLTERKINHAIAQMQQFSDFVKGKFLSTGENIYTDSDVLPQELDIKKEDVLAALKPFAQNEPKLPVYKHSDVPEARDAIKLYEQWTKQQSSHLKRRELEDMIQKGIFTRDVELAQWLDRETIFVEAGFHDPKYLRSVAEEIRDSFRYARQVGSPEMIRKIKEKFNEINAIIQTAT